ncbi:hypothetical protein C6W92_15505 [Roseovarius sp. A46]|uniref:hypothetical protein n=1 Tax=Roseovarius sp. A46 TaxID=2109331 RepID=UPI0010128CF7|nr:hypothetical protein [Roseovarius sp. A46]RXV59243.1 hypothetical protein C6W92_15505 [Roseovarius sp. A46]
MTETNLQKSELVISKILERLLDLGLQQGTRLSFEDLDLPKEHAPIYNGCCAWLIEEGVIRCSNKSQALAGNLVMVSPMITSRGFALLDQPFVVDDDKMRVGQAVKEVADGQRNYAGIGDFVGGLLGGFTKSMGS